MIRLNILYKNKPIPNRKSVSASLSSVLMQTAKIFREIIHNRNINYTYQKKACWDITLL